MFIRAQPEINLLQPGAGKPPPQLSTSLLASVVLLGAWQGYRGRAIDLCSDLNYVKHGFAEIELKISHKFPRFFQSNLRQSSDTDTTPAPLSFLIQTLPFMISFPSCCLSVVLFKHVFKVVQEEQFTHHVPRNQGVPVSLPSSFSATLSDAQ